MDNQTRKRNRNQLHARITNDLISSTTKKPRLSVSCNDDCNLTTIFKTECNNCFIKKYDDDDTDNKGVMLHLAYVNKSKMLALMIYNNDTPYNYVYEDKTVIQRCIEDYDVDVLWSLLHKPQVNFICNKNVSYLSIAFDKYVQNNSTMNEQTPLKLLLLKICAVLKRYEEKRVLSCLMPSEENLNNIISREYRNIITKAIRINRLDVLTMMLLEPINSNFIQERTIIDVLLKHNQFVSQIVIAAQVGNFDTIRIMVDHGFKFDVRQVIDHTTAIHYLTLRGELEIIKFVIDKFYDDNTIELIYEPTKQDNLTILHYAATYNKPDVLQYLLTLIECKAFKHDVIERVNTQSMTALSCAFVHKHIECASIIMNAYDSSRTRAKLVHSINVKGAKEMYFDLERWRNKKADDDDSSDDNEVLD